jgi:hypothetical protein
MLVAWNVMGAVYRGENSAFRGQFFGRVKDSQNSILAGAALLLLF